MLLTAFATWGFSKALSRQYTFDAIAYAWQIEQFGLTGKPGFLFHPHHLLFNLVGFLWWRLIGGAPGFQRALAAQQMLSAVAGSAAVALCYVAARQATGSRLLALALALVMGAGLGLWMIATDGGIYALGLALCAATLWLAMRLLEKPGTRLAIALGAVAAAAALIHQMHFLLAPAVAAAPLLGARTQRQQVRLSLATLGTYAALLPGTYLLAAKARGCEDAAAIWRWLTLYGQDGRWWDFHIARNLGLDLHALVRAFTADPGGLVARLEALGRTSFIPIAAGLAALLLLATLYRGRQLLLCVLWLIPYAAFFTVWVPGYPSYWVPMAFGLLLVAALLLESGARALQSLSAATQRLNIGWRARKRETGCRVFNLVASEPAISAPRGLPLAALVRVGALVVGCLAAWELAAINRPLIQWRRHEGANPYLLIARAVETHTRGRDEASRRASDLVLIAGSGYYASAETYIPYFARRNLVTLASALKQHGPGSGRTRAEAIEWLRERIRRSWKLGAQVYVFQTPETPALAARPIPGESPATGDGPDNSRRREEPRRSRPPAPSASNRSL
jgi:4-amino-4-deoxy-L-arabinose transferase-like glycosyltransferase